MNVPWLISESRVFSIFPALFQSVVWVLSLERAAMTVILNPPHGRAIPLVNAA